MRLASRLRLVALVVILTTTALLGTVSFSGMLGVMRADRQADALARSRAHATGFRMALEELLRDVAAIRGLPSVARVNIARRRGGDVEGALTDLAEDLEAFLAGKHHYFQARLIAADQVGKELVRVDRAGEVVARVPDAALQRKGDRPYMRETLDTPWPGVYLSALELNRERGVIESPRRPTVRGGSVVLDDDAEPWAVVVLNVDATEMLSQAFSERVGFRDYLTNDRFDFLVHPDPTKTFGFDLGTRHGLADEFPSIAAELGAGSDHAEPEFSRTIAAFERVDVGWGEGTVSRTFFVGTAVQTPSVGTFDLLWQLSVLVPIVVAATLGVFGWVAWTFVRPLDQITRAATEVSSGHDPGTLPVTERSEVGTLARTFDTMLRAVKDKEAALRRANVDLESFARIAAHDLREPARRMSALADLLAIELGPDKSAATSEVLAHIRSSAAGLMAQIAAFRQLAGLEKGVVARASCAIDDILDQILQESARTLEVRGVQVERDAMPVMRIYRDLVASLYRNLVANALQHTAGAGISLRFTASEDPELGMVLGVRNTGSTIPEAELEQVFLPFHRLGHSSDGDGIGLAIARRIAERHRGRIWAESGPDFVHIRFILADEAEDDG